MRPTLNPNQAPADVAVVLPTIVRPSLLKAARSVFHQNYDGRIQLLIGVDVCQGDRAILDVIAAECPAHVTLTILDPGYSTSARHGGTHANGYSGSLRTVMSFLANAYHVAYLDDNDWWSANHLHLLNAAIKGKQWAWSGRWLVHPETGGPICRDEWDSVGPGQGINAERWGGFVQPSGLMINMRACSVLMPLWSMAMFADGGGEDRLIFDQLNKNHEGAGTGQFTSFCTLSPDALTHDHHKEQFLARHLDWIYDTAAQGRIKALKETAQKLLGKDDLLGAERTVSECLALNPYDAEGLYLLAFVKKNSGMIEEAIVTLAQAIMLNDQQQVWIDTLAHWLQQADRLEDVKTIRSSLARRFHR